MKKWILVPLAVLMVLTVQNAKSTDLFQTIQQQALETRCDCKPNPLSKFSGRWLVVGLFHTASTHGVLGFDIGIQATSAIIPEGKSRLLDSAKVSIVPLPVVQANLGLPMQFEVMVRGVGYKYQGQTLSLFGVGLKNDISNLIPIPGFPHIGVMGTYHSFKGGDILTASVASFLIMASKSFLVIEPYAGFGFDRTAMKFKYTYTGTTPNVAIDEKFTQSTSRLTLGVALSPFPLVKVHAEYNMSKFNSFTAGLAVSFR